ADDADLRLHRAADDGGGVGRVAGGREQVVGAAPHRVQGVGVGAAAVGGKVAGGLGGQRRDEAERAGHVDAVAGAAGGEVGAGLAVALGSRGGAVEVGQPLRPDQARVGGELAGDGLHLRRQQGAEIAGGGEAVAEEDRLRERVVVRGGGKRGQRQRCGEGGADG